jgi:CDP-diacylglycerol--glycerol-3-phosphate 3-phosphatidyltransferase
MIDYKNIPNYFTLLRIILVPIIVIFYYFPFAQVHIVATVLFIIASLTDFLDGYLARRWKVSSGLGAFLDPVADKVLIVICLTMVVSQERLHFIVLATLVIVAREIIVSGLREWMAEVGKRAHVAVSYVGKWKTACQMVAIMLLLFSSKTSPLLITWLGVMLIYIAAILTLWSMVMYIKAAWPALIKE